MSPVIARTSTRTRTRSRPVVYGVLILSLGLSGCTGSTSPSPAGPKTCATVDLALDYHGGEPESGSDFGDILIRNVGAQPCALIGPVALTGTDRAGKPVTTSIGYPVQAGLVLSPHAVRVPFRAPSPNGEVVADLRVWAPYRDDSRSPIEECQPQHAMVPAYWRVNFPNGTRTLPNATPYDPHFPKFNFKSPIYDSLLTCRGRLTPPGSTGEPAIGNYDLMR